MSKRSRQPNVTVDLGKRKLSILSQLRLGKYFGISRNLNIMRGIRDRLTNAEMLECPGVHDPLTARVAAAAGSEAIYMTG